MTSIHWPAVVAAFLFDVFFGFAWYGPLFGALWFAEQGLDPSSMEGNGAVYGISMAANLLKVWCVAAVVGLTKPQSAWDGMKVAWLVWLGAVVVIHLGGTLFAGRSMTVLAINMSFHAIAFGVFGALFGGWRRSP
ncbi:MAG: DUF1761 domain-containing protein [Myxococcales bacterium]|nr:DUF1761 domain-containing protein [Myxococcales bacterium]